MRFAGALAALPRACVPARYRRQIRGPIRGESMLDFPYRGVAGLSCPDPLLTQPASSATITRRPRREWLERPALARGAICYA